MIESFLSMYKHPIYVGNVLSVINDLSHIGLDSCGQTVEYLIMSGSEDGVDGLLERIETTVETALVAAFSQFGVSIDYQAENVTDHLELLNFLAQWGTEEGYNKNSIALDSTLRDIGVADNDVLVELFARCTGVDRYAYIDWVLSVEKYLIDTIEGQFATEEDEEDQGRNELVTDSILNPFRSFAAHYGNTAAVKYVRLGGRLGLPLLKLLEVNEAQLISELPDRFAEELVGFGLLSDTPRNELAVKLAEVVESTYGPTAQARNCLHTVNKILELVKGA